MILKYARSVSAKKRVEDMASLAEKQKREKAMDNMMIDNNNNDNLHLVRLFRGIEILSDSSLHSLNTLKRRYWLATFAEGMEDYTPRDFMRLYFPELVARSPEFKKTIKSARNYKHRGKTWRRIIDEFGSAGPALIGGALVTSSRHVYLFIYLSICL